MRKWMVTCLVIVSLLLLSCAHQDVKDASDQMNDQTEISIWHNFSGGDLRAQAVQKLIKDFQIKHPTVKVNVQEISISAYRERINTAAASNELPDVFLGYPGSFTDEYYRNELIQPITPLIEEYPEWAGDFLDDALRSFEYDGEIYAAPVAISATSFLYYNKALFAQCDLSIPTTWDELLEAIDIFNAMGITPISMGNRDPWVAQSTTFSSIAAEVTGEEWFIDILHGEAAHFTDDIFIEALTYFKELIDRNAYQTDASWINNEIAEQYFAEGNAAMMINGSWTISSLAGTASEEIIDNVGVTTFPMMKKAESDKKAMTGGPGGGFLLSSETEGVNKEAALALIYALSNEEAQRALVESESLIMYDVEINQEEVSSLFYEAYHVIKEVEFKPVYDIHLDSMTAEALNAGLQEIMIGRDVKLVAKKIEQVREHVEK